MRILTQVALAGMMLSFSASALTIDIEMPDGKTITLDNVWLEDTIQNVKELILDHKEGGIPTKEQRLMFGGNVLDDKESSDKYIGTTLKLKKVWMLTIRIPQGLITTGHHTVEVLQLSVNDKDDIQEVKHQIFKQTGIPADHQRLSKHSGKACCRESLLQNGINKWSTLYLTVQLPADDKTTRASIVIRKDLYDTGREDLGYTNDYGHVFNFADTIKEVKRQLEERLRIPVDHQVLWIVQLKKTSNPELSTAKVRKQMKCHDRTLSSYIDNINFHFTRPDFPFARIEVLDMRTLDDEGNWPKK